MPPGINCQFHIPVEGRNVVLYSVLPPESDTSIIWKILDEYGDDVFAGPKPQCEEWLDLAYSSEVAGCWPAEHGSDGVINRLSIFALATALLGRV
jgi:hypothetical protein